jgi:hypothetical protein
VKLLASTVGRCVKLFAWEEVRPEHGVNASILVAAIAERFNFQFRPPAPVQPDAVLKFGEGSTLIDKNLIAISKLDVYSDGFAVGCANTDDAKLVSDEIVRWAQSDLGYRDFIRQPQIVFLSQVLVEFDPDFEHLFRQWKKLQSLLNASVQKRYNFTSDVDFHRVQFRADAHTVVNNLLVSDFNFERKVSDAYTSNRWLCEAPLPTDEWVELLGSIEAFAKSDYPKGTLQKIKSKGANAQN